MSKIDDLIKKLELKKKKIEFLTHILDSANGYENEDFAEVKEDVLKLLGKFTEAAIKSIENDAKMSISTGSTKKAVPTKVEKSDPNSPYNSTPPTEEEKIADDAAKAKDPNYLMRFAMDNRELGGKQVQVINDKNLDIKGEVVGLDAPNVVVKTKAGQIIKVPLEQINVL